MSRVYVGDTNIWIDFENAGLLKELFRLPFSFCCTEFVAEELSVDIHQLLLDLGLIVEIIDADNIVLLFELMAGQNNSSLADVSCFFLAKQAGLPLLTGDRKLRKQAISDGLSVYGSLWLLDLLVNHKIVSREKAALSLEIMLERGARFPHQECLNRRRDWLN